MPDLFTAWVLPLLYGTGCVLVFLSSSYQWRIARATVALALAASVLVIATELIAATATPLIADSLGMTVAMLVSLLGWVIVNYSERYLNGDLHQPRFVKAMLFTLFCVSVLVVSQHLLTIVLAWSGTSIGLHFLLTHYRGRKTAQIVAHKKFLVSRLAEVCLGAALVLVFQETGALTLDGLSASITDSPNLSPALHWAALLFALAAILKSAQLPLHGWLIQVMEAPTPVSALLHAGVINIGGFVLLRLADLISQAPAAQALLVVVGSVTAVLAGLVMMTRVSIKVRLAWSTCAQMGFMLMEVGLGLYELALLHLVAHSLYKAHAFLSAGEIVEVARSNAFFSERNSVGSPLWNLAGLVIAAALVAASAALWQIFIPAYTVPWVVLLIVALGLAPLLWLPNRPDFSALLYGSVIVVGLTQLYLLWHLLFAGLAPAATSISDSLVVWVAFCFMAFYLTQMWLRSFPHGRLATALYPWAYCGFYLDETITRLTFKIWPPRLNPTQAHTQTHYTVLQGDTL